MNAPPSLPGRCRGHLVVRIVVRNVAAACLVAAATAPMTAHASDTVRGQETYRKQCAACHGDNGRPLVPGAPDFSRRTTLLKPDPMLLKAIREGKGPMPAYEGILRDMQILDVIAYLRTLS